MAENAHPRRGSLCLVAMSNRDVGEHSDQEGYVEDDVQPFRG